MLLKKMNTVFKTIFGYYGIGVKKQNIISLTLSKGFVIGFGKTIVGFGGNKFYTWKKGLQVMNTSILAGIIYNKYFSINICYSFYHTVQTLL